MEKYLNGVVESLGEDRDRRKGRGNSGRSQRGRKTEGGDGKTKSISAAKGKDAEAVRESEDDLEEDRDRRKGRGNDRRKGRGNSGRSKRGRKTEGGDGKTKFSAAKGKDAEAVRESEDEVQRGQGETLRSSDRKGARGRDGDETEVKSASKKIKK